MSRRLEDVHREILETAARDANRRIAEALPDLHGANILRPAPLASKGRLSLTVEETVWPALTKEQRVTVKDVARESMYKAIQQHISDVMGLYVGMAKQGKSYPEVFEGA